MPAYIADEYYVEVTGLREMLVDYYIEAVDGNGIIAKSPIQHVYIGDGSGSGGPGGDTVVVSPDPPQAGQNVTITYDATGRALESSSQVLLHYGFNGWNPVISPDAPMTWNATDSVWEVTVPVQSTATVLDFVFTDGAGAWDNNNGQDWHYTVEGGVPPQEEWVMDGALDTNATFIDSNGGMVLYAGLIGNQLYVATLDARDNYDHFILVASPPSYPRAAMWAKAGQVANWAAFIGNESDNHWAGWTDNAGAVTVAADAGSGYLEGTIDLAGEFGSLPSSIWLAAAQYPTSEGTSLKWQTQVPASTNSDGNIDANEYIEVNLCAVTVDHAPADLNKDCAIDLADLDVFTTCLAGPGAGFAPTCPADTDADLDNDGDSDLADYAQFQQAYTH
jgi:hypothetical protein